MLKLLHRAIDRAAERTPDHEAVRCEDRHINWSELVARADALAGTLREHGTAVGDRVGVLLDKSIETVVAIHGIMRAGAAWVPLDPGAPPSRHAFVVRDCGIRHLVTHERRRASLRALLAEGATIDLAVGVAPGDDLPCASLAWSEVLAVPVREPIDTLSPEDLAYVIYTSGSTGVPKGIMHTHASGLAFCECVARLYDLLPHDRVSNQAPLHFDISIFDLLGSAVAGATSVLVPEMYPKMPASYSQLLAEQRVSVFFTVPFALSQLLLRGALETRDLSALRLVLFGGENMPTKHLRSLMAILPHARFHNMYGPAEVNGCTGYDVVHLDPHDDRPVPIGGAFPGMTCLVLTADRSRARPGDSGELLVAGPTRMKGYWGRDDLNARAFWTRPEDGLVFYRTGDLVEVLPHDEYRFLGRIDRQIKTRGYRVELDEIEAALLSHPEVEEAAVYAVPHEDTQRIEAAVHARRSVPDGELLEHLRQRIPSYALPTRVLFVEDFPRISSGKVDYRTLRRRAMAEVDGSP